MRWSIPIIVVALAACILAGSLGFQNTVKETTEYETVLSDLSSIADADPVTDTVNYNPLTNVTGWSSNVSFETQSAASLYKYETNLVWETRTSAAMNSSGVWVLEPTPLVNTTLKEWDWSDGVVDDGGQSIRNPPSGDVIGGWSGNIISTDGPITQTISSSVHATLGGTQYAYARTLKSFSIANNSVVQPTDAANGGVLGVMTVNPGTWAFNDDVRGENIRWTATMDLGTYTLLDFDVYYQDGLFYRINYYDEIGRPQLDSSTAYTISLVSDSLNANFTYRTLTSSNVLYIKPYAPAYLPSTAVSTWSNGYTNTTVQFLADAKDLFFTFNGDLIPDEGLEDTQDAAYATWANGYTGMVLFTMSANGTNYWQGVTSYNNTKDFTVAEYRYELLTPYNVNVPIDSITFYYAGTGTHRVAIVDTWVPRDSNGFLWGNATFPLDTLFPTLWAEENLRVKFNSFVTTGTGVTINGITYPVEDGNIIIDGISYPEVDGVITINGIAYTVTGEYITVNDAIIPVVDGYVRIGNSPPIPVVNNSVTWNGVTYPVTGGHITYKGEELPVINGSVTIDGDTFKLAGSLLEWTPDGSTTLIAPNGKAYDLGTRSGTFTLNGVWYGVLSLDTFVIIEEPAKEAVYGEMPAVGWMAWVFLGVLVVCTVGVLATGRQLDMTDMLALALLGFASLTVAVIV